MLIEAIAVVGDSHLSYLLEDGEGPRWSFAYDRYKHDPTPDALILGVFRHPNTGNNLVGAINLRYLDKNQVENLRKILPKLMSGRNLYARYHIGSQLLPDVFESYYRTYNAEYVRSVERGVLYPRYGYFKTAADFVKKKVGGLFKSKEQRKLDAMPKYPDDLRDVDTRIDAALRNKVQDKTATPQQQVELAKANEKSDPSDATVKAVENIPQQQLKEKELENAKKMASGEPKTVDKAKDAVQDEMQENDKENAQEELKDVEDINPNLIDQELKEAYIRYYDPRTKEYIVEVVNLWETEKDSAIYTKNSGKSSKILTN